MPNGLRGKSTYGSRETELYSGARRMFRESRMCLQTIHYMYATKGEITGMIARGGGGHLGIFRVGMCRPGLQIGTPF